MTKREKTFRQAARQVVIILDHFEADRDRVDKEVMDILKKNMDMSLKWTYNSKRTLSEQSGILSETYTLMNFLLRNYIFPKRDDGNKIQKDKLDKFKKLLKEEKASNGNGGRAKRSKFRRNFMKYYEMSIDELEKERDLEEYGDYEEEKRKRLYREMFRQKEKSSDDDRYELLMKKKRYKNMLIECGEAEEGDFPDKSSVEYDEDDAVDEYDWLFDDPDEIDEEYDETDRENAKKRNFYEDIMQMKKRYDGGESLDFLEWLREKYRVLMRKESEQI